jgi:hypothetical protein
MTEKWEIKYFGTMTYPEARQFIIDNNEWHDRLSYLDGWSFVQYAELLKARLERKENAVNS